ncbi:TPA: hypothetical protein ACH3X2_007129 [Trebouxia sp. C0005]
MSATITSCVKRLAALLHNLRGRSGRVMCSKTQVCTCECHSQRMSTKVTAVAAAGPVTAVKVAAPQLAMKQRNICKCCDKHCCLTCTFTMHGCLCAVPAYNQ